MLSLFGKMVRDNPQSRAEEIWRVCENLERVEDLSTLTDLLYLTRSDGSEVDNESGGKDG
jgi:hypothetical protein